MTTILNPMIGKCEDCEREETRRVYCRKSKLHDWRKVCIKCCTKSHDKMYDPDYTKSLKKHSKS